MVAVTIIPTSIIRLILASFMVCVSADGEEQWLCRDGPRIVSLQVAIIIELT
jgi:hypothetical protein